MWDLFSSAELERREREHLNEARNADLARAVAAREADARAAQPSSSARVRIPAEGMRVGEVNAAARELIEGVFPPLWVHGEVTGFTRARTGHCYFTLRDGRAQLRCVMWR